MSPDTNMTQTERPNATCSTATRMWLSVAVTIPVMARKLGLELHDMGETIHFTRGVSRPWLKPHPLRPAELQFDPDVFARNLGVWSSGEVHCALFLLNVWNESYARTKGWHFDLFRALSAGLDHENREAIAQWLTNPIWP